MSTNTNPFQPSASADERVMVLLVDDQAMVAEAVRRMFAHEASIDFHYCSDPQSAIEVAANVRPTVILQRKRFGQLGLRALLKDAPRPPGRARVSDALVQKIVAYGANAKWAEYGLDKPEYTITGTYIDAGKTETHTVKLNSKTRFARIDDNPAAVLLVPFAAEARLTITSAGST